MDHDTNHLLITTIITLCVSVICCILSFFLATIHLRQEILMERFFKVVFTLILIEFGMNFMITINTILLLCLGFKYNNNWCQRIVGFFNNLFFASHISYNLIIIIHVIKESRMQEQLIQEEIDRQSSRDYSVQLRPESFKYIYIIGGLIGVIQSFICLGVDSSSVYYLPVGNYEGPQNLYYFIIFILNYCYFILSFIYTVISCDRFNMSELIKLRNYSQYCLCTSLLWMVFFFVFLMRILDIKEHYLFYIETVCFSVLLITNSFFHLNSYYMGYILGYKGNSLYQKISMGVKLLLYLEEVPELNFIDFNASYIIHSLISKKDFLNESVEHSTLKPFICIKEETNVKNKEYNEKVEEEEN